MKRSKIFDYANDRYNSNPEYLWKKYPGYAILRHTNNHKWFAIIMEVDKIKLGINTAGTEDIMNIKLKPEEIDILQNSTDFLPAYHMNKTHWISVRLALVTDKEIYQLLDTSYTLTK